MTTPRKANVVTEFLRGKKVQIIGTLFYPHLLVPKQEPNKAPKFGCMVAWDMNTNQQAVQELQQLFAQVKQQFHGQIPEHNWVNPLKNYNTTRKTNGEQYGKHLAGKFWINAANNEKFAPQLMIVDAQAPNGMRQLMQTEAMQLFDGQKVVVSLSFFGLHGENMKYGISTNVDAVLVVGGGERVVLEGGNGVNTVEAFGNFLNMMGQSGQQHQQQNQPQQNYQQQAPQHNNMGNGQNHANMGTNHNGQMNHGNQTQGGQMGGYGQPVHTGASHFNQSNQQQPHQTNYYQQGNYGGPNNGNNGGGLV
jgi:hypothetical protein